MTISTTLKERFDRNVKPIEGGCLEWQAARNRGGYGVISVAAGKARGAHVVAWFLCHGEWPAGVVMHTCDNPACVNVSHLCVGTQSENKLDAKRKGRIAQGPTHGMTKISTDQVAEMRQLRLAGETLAVLSAKFNVSQSNVSTICRGRTRLEG